MKSRKFHFDDIDEVMFDFMLNLQLCLNLFVYDRNIFESFLEVFSNLRKFTEMFGYVRLAFAELLENLRESSKSGRESSENRQNLRYWFIYIKNKIMYGCL